MAAPASRKICKVCRKEVRDGSWVGDDEGGGWCEPCLIQLQAKWTAAPARPVDDDDLYALKDEPVHRPAPPPRVSAAAAGSSAPIVPPKLPSRCPACGTPVITKSVICMKCMRDMTKMDKLLAIQAEGSKAPDRTERAAALTANIIRGVLAILILGFVTFTAYSLYMLYFSPKGPFSGYPTSHEKLIRDYLTDISLGTETGYDQAFLLVSFRVRTTPNREEVNFYKRHFAKINDAFNAKYGPGWIKDLDVGHRGLDIGISDDLVEYTFNIRQDEYHITTQVQISVDTAIINRIELLKNRKTYPEDGKNHYGVVEIAEYPVDWHYKPKPPKN